LIPKESVFVGRCREKNSQRRMTNVGVWGQNPQPPETRESGGKAPSFWQFLQLFNEKNTFLGIYRLKFLLKNVFLISSIVQND